MNRKGRRWGVQIEGFFFDLQGFFLKLAFSLSIAVTPLLLVQSGVVGILEGLAEVPEDATPFGFYSTSYLASGAFLLSLLFYSGYREELSEEPGVAFFVRSLFSHIRPIRRQCFDSGR